MSAIVAALSSGVFFNDREVIPFECHRLVMTDWSYPLWQSRNEMRLDLYDCPHLPDRGAGLLIVRIAQALLIVEHEIVNTQSVQLFNSRIRSHVGLIAAHPRLRQYIYRKDWVPSAVDLTDPLYWEIQADYWSECFDDRFATQLREVASLVKKPTDDVFVAVAGSAPIWKPFLSSSA